MNTINDQFSLAIFYHTGGNIAEAKRLYQQMLAVDPNNEAVLNNLGLITPPPMSRLNYFHVQL